MFKKSVMIPVLLILLAAIAWWLVISAERRLVGAQEMTQVLVARNDLAAGTALNEDLLEIMQMPRLYIQRDAYEMRSPVDIKLVTGLVTAVRIPKGNQITMSCLLNGGPKGKGDGKLPSAQQHYLEGLKYFQSGDYKKAREEWTLARKLNPSNTDAEAGLKRIEQIYGSGR